MTGGMALILGRTGRNVAAGMSGGTAYILDLDPSRINPLVRDTGDLVLATVEAGSEDAERVEALLREHVELTGSRVAAEILDSAQDWPTRFTLLTPRQYASVLRIRADAEEAGEDPDGAHAWQLILEESHG
jgi:glutamate synthase (NADPH/NADH) large chain